LGDFFDEVACFGIGALTSIFLEPWYAVPVGTASTLALKKTGYPSRLRNRLAIYGGKKMLKDMAGGRIEIKLAKTE
jgi:hypothetical protein